MTRRRTAVNVKRRACSQWRRLEVSLCVCEDGGVDDGKLGSIAKDIREHSGKTIKDWAGDHEIGTTVISEFERLGKIPPTGRIRRALERAYQLPDRSLDRIALGDDVAEVISEGAARMDDRLPLLVRRLRDLVDELARAVGEQ